ncbi:hypothetical protein BD289DRAFT_425737 [Coniella lustricola]|uniref:Uncharacterized protein n=1 Tax=Coniella lustricola TaxID=2025994 RepID=A0A2T3AH58_9PEZI|nr:hypothetical protein BD289DRAFT_425737 [Coniella lustricola]
MSTSRELAECLNQVRFSGPGVHRLSASLSSSSTVDGPLLLPACLPRYSLGVEMTFQHTFLKEKLTAVIAYGKADILFDSFNTSCTVSTETFISPVQSDPHRDSVNFSNNSAVRAACMFLLCVLSLLLLVISFAFLFCLALFLQPRTNAVAKLLGKNS